MIGDYAHVRKMRRDRMKKLFAITCSFEPEKEGGSFKSKTSNDSLKVLRFTGPTAEKAYEGLMKWLDKQQLSDQERKQFMAAFRDALGRFLDESGAANEEK
jgi:hypothetical protein